MNRVRLRIKRRVMLARCLVDLRRIAAQFVPEPIQINPLAPRDQPFFVRPVEIEMPRLWI